MHEAVSNQVSSLLPVPEVDWAHIESITAEAMRDDIDKLELTDQELHDPVCPSSDHHRHLCRMLQCADFRLVESAGGAGRAAA